MKTYEVFDQRTPKKRKDGWDANLVHVGKVEATDSGEALRFAKRLARFPVLYNHENFLSALRDEKKTRLEEVFA